jgi:hypothetical protein
MKNIDASLRRLHGQGNGFPGNAQVICKGNKENLSKLKVFYG